MNAKRLILFIAIVLAVVGAGWAVRYATSSHDHLWVKVTTPEGKVYWTCPMHPQVRQPTPGNCPICGMKLVKRTQSGAQPNAVAGVASSKPERRVLYWYDPMRPDVHFDKAGKSPFMDMQLVPKYADEAESALIEVDPRVVQTLGMRTAVVTRGELDPGTEAVGSVEVDERRIRVIEARASGWVERLEVRAVGDPVREGQIVARIYSPELYAAQEELLVARRGGDEALTAAARERLRSLGVSQAQVGRILSSGRAQRQVDVASPAQGVVTELNAREGEQVAPGQPLMRIADLSRVWIVAAVPESQAGLLTQGTRAQARVAGLPGRQFAGEVEYVYPRLDTQTRTVRARISVPNPDLALKPGMYASLRVEHEAGAPALLVPSEAVIRTGTRTVVIVAERSNHFRPVSVSIGAEHGDDIEVLDGLAEGDRVVVSGQFLIDSEASLRGAFERMGGVANESGDPPAGRVRLQGSGAGPSVIGQPTPSHGSVSVKEQP